METADADQQAAERRPPHPMDRQMLKAVLGGIHGQRQQRRQSPGQHARYDAHRQRSQPDEGGMNRHRKQRPAAQDIETGNRGGHARHRHRNHAARLPFEQQQLDGEHQRGKRRVEGRRHARRRARHQQRLALRAGQMKELRDHRSKRAAGHDDGAFGSEWSSRSDGDGGGQRLQNRHLRLHAASVDQNGFDRFRDAMPSNAVRTESRHQPDDQRAAHRNEYGPDA